jgi:ketosteroid isomerase-like protein
MTEIAKSPEQAVQLLDEAFNRGDLDAVLSFYEEGAVLVAAGPPRVVQGTAALREFFAQAMRSGLIAKQIKTSVIEAEGVALFLSRWSLAPCNPDSTEPARTFHATSVFRRQSDGSWKLLIDNPIGPLVLDLNEDSGPSHTSQASASNGESR